ncbi:GTP 3',8-cyclase [Propionigenium maris DSM 9537]|uniref:GTP 3',8-cyclase n=2 Tax=Propionigenium TaxID=2332 RepID=A0A9W6GJY5_9FUSO|nr:GTP 3',8-cyclase [Propionigenium maris DSM 9537]
MDTEEVISLVRGAAKLGVRKVRFTGGEPLLRRDIVEIIERTSSIDGIDDIGLTTNALLLENLAPALKKAGLKRINISLDTLRENRYLEMTGGRIQKVFKGIEAAQKAGFNSIKINSVLIKDFNEDEIVDLCELTRERDIHVRFIELMPMGDSTSWSSQHYLSSKTVLERCPDLRLVDREYAASPSLLYSYPEGKGRVGIINPLSDKFCSSCNRIRVTSQGRLKLCLHSDREIDLLTALRRGESIERIIQDALTSKPSEHKLEEGEYISKNMVSIGG